MEARKLCAAGSGIAETEYHGRHTWRAAEVEIWKEFNNNWERLAFDSELLLGQITGRARELKGEEQEFPEGTSRESLVRTRINQGFFRAAVLAAYGARCCITGLSIPQLLTASHIVPWSVDVKNRTNPRNGLCLNAIHDRAFDCGLLTITPELKVRVSSSVKANPADAAAREFLRRYDGASISPPCRFAPSADFLRYHNERIFLGP